MERSCLINYIKKHFNADEDIINCLTHELNSKIYYYGDNFRRPAEGPFIIKSLLKTVLNGVLSECGFLFNALSKNRITTRRNNIISNSYFSFDDELRNIGYNVYGPFWRSGKFIDLSAERQLTRAFNGIRNSLENSDFIEILNETFFKKIKTFRESLKDFYLDRNIAALVLAYDMPFFERLSINIFKEIKRPSFVFLHGFPGMYNNIDENRSDYLIVWGNKIKDGYISAGVPGQKIFVSGHPSYKEFYGKKLAFDLKDILVLTKSITSNQLSDGIRLADRGNSILYLYSIQDVLKKMGVGSVRFRVHPSENHRWYYRFIDKGFFKLDDQCLSDSIKRSTLVIGPASSVFLESIYQGVNYVLYDPIVDDVDLLNFKLAPPFNGNDPRIPVAKNEDELMKFLTDTKKVDISFFSDYVKTPFDIRFMKDLIVEG